MKKILFLTIIATLTTFLDAQSIKVKSIKKVPLKKEAFFPSFGRNSNEVILTGRNYNGLTIYDARTKKETVVSKAQGAGANYEIDKENNLSYRTEEIEKGKRSFQDENFALAPAKKSFKLFKKPTPTASKDHIEVKIEGKKINLIQDNEQLRTIAPIADSYFLWASVSPDSKRILFTAPGKGTFICDLDGNIQAELGYLNSPEWMNNEWILGMNDKDDGHTIISSDIIAIHAPSGKKANLTEKTDEIAIYPKASPENDKIVFHNPKGEIYILNVKLRK